MRHDDCHPIGDAKDAWLLVMLRMRHDDAQPN